MTPVKDVQTAVAKKGDIDVAAQRRLSWESGWRGMAWGAIDVSPGKAVVGKGSGGVWQARLQE